MSKTVLIDPGHGGSNTGTVQGNVSYERQIVISRTGEEEIRQIPVDADFIEKEWTLQVARLVEKKLASNDQVVCVLTREMDVYTTFRHRRYVEQKHGADFVVSIHANSLPQRPDFTRFEGYHWPGSVAGWQAACALADLAPEPLGRGAVINAINDPTTNADDWIEAPRHVLGTFDAPTLLAECGYASNERARLYMLSLHGQGVIADVIVQAALVGLGLYLRS